jgi:uncharacterized membrane protein YciS (DUF1049 family)
MKTVLRIAAVIALLAYAALVVARNRADVTLDLVIFPALAVEVWHVLLMSALVGAALTALLLAWPILRLRLQVRSQSRQVTRLEQEVHGLRTLPIAESDETGAAASAREG